MKKSIVIFLSIIMHPYWLIADSQRSQKGTLEVSKQLSPKKQRKTFINFIKTNNIHYKTLVTVTGLLLLSLPLWIRVFYYNKADTPSHTPKKPITSPHSAKPSTITEICQITKKEKETDFNHKKRYQGAAALGIGRMLEVVRIQIGDDANNLTDHELIMKVDLATLNLPEEIKADIYYMKLAIAQCNASHEKSISPTKKSVTLLTKKSNTSKNKIPSTQDSAATISF